MIPTFRYLVMILSCCLALPGMPVLAAAQSTPKAAPDLDISIQYYSRTLTAEGVLRESRYEENMLRRPGHVWVARVLPKVAIDAHDGEQSLNKVAAQQPSAIGEHADKHFNHAVVPRHVSRDGNQTRIEFVDMHDRSVIYIAPTEYENVNFDGSWANAFYLIDPQGLAMLPLTSRNSSIAGARWHEREKNGLFQRVLWDGVKMIPLVVESGDRDGTFFRRIEVKVRPDLSTDLPWQHLKGYAQKEYSDFLD